MYIARGDAVSTVQHYACTYFVNYATPLSRTLLRNNPEGNKVDSSDVT